MYSKELVTPYHRLDWRIGRFQKPDCKPPDIWSCRCPFWPIMSPYPFPSHMPDSPPPRATWCRLYTYIHIQPVSKMATSSVSPVPQSVQTTTSTSATHQFHKFRESTTACANYFHLLAEVNPLGFGQPTPPGATRCKSSSRFYDIFCYTLVFSFTTWL